MRTAAPSGRERRRDGLPSGVIYDWRRLLVFDGEALARKAWVVTNYRLGIFVLCSS
jgi:hypothetical protein